MGNFNYSSHVRQGGKKMKNYGWTSYKSTGWKAANGKKFYEGCFRASNDPYNYTLIRIMFIAKRPVIAMQEIVKKLNQGKLPHEIANTEIN
jgi:hypothetical protein